MIATVNRCFNSFRQRFDVPNYVEGVSDIVNDRHGDFIFDFRVKRTMQWRADEHIQLVYRRDNIVEWMANADLYEFVSHGK